MIVMYDVSGEKRRRRDTIANGANISNVIYLPAKLLLCFYYAKLSLQKFSPYIIFLNSGLSGRLFKAETKTYFALFVKGKAHALSRISPPQKLRPHETHQLPFSPALSRMGVFITLNEEILRGKEKILRPTKKNFLPTQDFLRGKKKMGVPLLFSVCLVLPQALRHSDAPQGFSPRAPASTHSLHPLSRLHQKELHPDSRLDAALVPKGQW